MIRSTTIKHELQFEDKVLSDAVQILVTYKQDQKKRSIVWAGSNTKVIRVDEERQLITIAWSQEKSKEFDPNRDMFVQVKLYNEDGDVAASDMIPTRVLDVLDDMELGGLVGSTEGWEWIYDDLTGPEMDGLADELDAEADGGDWDYSMSEEEARQLCEEMNIPYEEEGIWDVMLNSSEAAVICRNLKIDTM